MGEIIENITLTGLLYEGTITAEANATDIVSNELIEGVDALAAPESNFWFSILEVVLNTVLMLSMATLSIFCGSFLSVQYLKARKKHEPYPEIMSQRKVLGLPIFLSVALLVIYLIFQVIPKAYINFFFSTYFAFASHCLLYYFLSTFIGKHIPCRIQHFNQRLFSCNDPPNSVSKDMGHEIQIYLAECGISCLVDFLCLILSAILFIWYMWAKHWISNNICALVLALKFIQVIHLNTIANGCILLGGLFLYDVFWVYATDVMETVAMTLEAPNKLILPNNIIKANLSTRKYVMLGLGDVIIPGIVIALLLRFDKKLQRPKNTYFTISLLGYAAGLLGAAFTSAYFQAGQPALLFLVPSTLGLSILCSVFNGDFNALYEYKDEQALDNSKAVNPVVDDNMEKTPSLESLVKLTNNSSSSESLIANSKKDN